MVPTNTMIKAEAPQDEKLKSFEKAFSNQEVANKRVEEKNSDVEKTIAELDTMVNEITSAMTAVVDYLYLKSLLLKEANISNDARIPDMWITVTKNDLYVCFLILIFLISVLIGMHL